MPPIEDQRRASVTYARTSAFSELDHQHWSPHSQRVAAAHKPTGKRARETQLGVSAELRSRNGIWESLIEPVPSELRLRPVSSGWVALRL